MYVVRHVAQGSTKMNLSDGPVPDYEDRIIVEKTLGFFLRMVLVRCLREDRTTIGCAQFINNQLATKYTAPVTDGISDIFEESLARKPVSLLADSWQ